MVRVWQHGLTVRLLHDTERDIAVLDSTWDEGVSVGAAAQKVQVVILGTGEAWMQHAIAAMGNSFRGRAAGMHVLLSHLLCFDARYGAIPQLIHVSGASQQGQDLTIAPGTPLM